MRYKISNLGWMTAGLFLHSTAFAAVPLASNTLYMCEFKSNSSLFKVNHLNAQVTLVGPTLTSLACTDLTFRGTALFGTAFTKLLTINPTTGQATPKANSFGSGITDINALIAQPTTNKLFGAGSRTPGRFVEINPTTGRATLRGTYGPGLGSAGDLAFHNGVLFATLTNNASPGRTFLARISLSTGTVGKATLIGAIRRIAGGNTIFLRDVFGLAVRSGVLYGGTRSGEVLTINPSNAIATLKGDNNKVQAGFAVSPP